MLDADEAERYTTSPANTADQTLAELFHQQVDAFYSLPRKVYPRKEIVFSPSGVTKCARELFYMHTGAPADEQPRVPWRERLARNGTGVHDATQADYLKMEQALRQAGHTPRFRFLEAEIKGERAYQVGGVTVKLKGRCDGKLGVLDEAGNVTQEIIWEKKTKDKRGNLNKIAKAGRPQDEHKQQAVAYSLIWGIPRFLFEYESLAKPDWSDIEPEKPDLFPVYVEVTRDEAKALLGRLAKVVQQIESKQLPEPELDKCGFCPFHTQCAKDGGYKG